MEVGPNATKPHPGAPADEGHDGRPQQPSTYLVIPYFLGDLGRTGIERPLPATVASWLCPAIVVDGAPGTNQFTRGAQTSVTVQVANWGAGTTAAPVQVAVWWADPATGFTTPTLFGQTVVAVATGGAPKTSPPIVGTIPVTAPEHVCLLARVSSPLDAPPPGSPVAPATDRHWGQLNINAITVAPGAQFQFIFWAGNPFARPAYFDVHARPLGREMLGTVSRLLRKDLALGERMPLELTELRAGRLMPDGDDRGAGRDGRARRQLMLEPGRRRAIQLVGRLPDDAKLGSAVVLEVVQIRRDEREREQIVGSIGLIVTAGRRT